MKKPIFLFSFFLITYISCNQPVSVNFTYDIHSEIDTVNAYVTSHKNISNASKVSEQLKETVKFFQTAQEELSKEQRISKDVETAQNIARLHVSLLKNYSYYSGKATAFKHISASNLKAFNNNLNNILDEVQHLLNDAERTFRNDYHSMNEAEKMKFLSDHQDKLKQKLFLFKTEFNSLKSKEEAGTIRETIKNL